MSEAVLTCGSISVFTGEALQDDWSHCAACGESHRTREQFLVEIDDKTCRLCRECFRELGFVAVSLGSPERAGLAYYVDRNPDGRWVCSGYRMITHYFEPEPGEADRCRGCGNRNPYATEPGS